MRLCVSVSLFLFRTRSGFEPQVLEEEPTSVYCPDAGHKKNARPVVPSGESGYSSLLLFSDYPAFPDADISGSNTFSTPHTTVHRASEKTE